jgi:hypothetical protein
MISGRDVMYLWWEYQKWVQAMRIFRGRLAWRQRKWIKKSEVRNIILVMHAHARGHRLLIEWMEHSPLCK